MIFCGDSMFDGLDTFACGKHSTILARRVACRANISRRGCRVAYVSKQPNVGLSRYVCLWQTLDNPSPSSRLQSKHIETRLPIRH